MKSWNSNKNLDCFGHGAPQDIDHIWPLSKGGSNIKINKMHLSQISNKAKANKTKGEINNIRFSIIRAIDKEGNIYGRLQININEQWIFVDPIN